MSDDLTAVLARLEALEARNAELEAKVAELTAVPPPPLAPTPAAPAAIAPAGIDRRRMLRTGLAAAGAAAATAVVAGGTPAAATNGDAVKVGATNYGTAETVLNYDGLGFTNSVLTVTDSSGASSEGRAIIEAAAIGTIQKTGIRVSGQQIERGVHVEVTSVGNAYKGVHSKTGLGTAIHGEVTSGTAVQGTATSGLGAQFSSSSGAAMQVSSETGNGILAYSPIFQLYLGNLESRNAPTQDTVAHFPGELVADSSGDLWHCVGQGTPGVWRKLSSPKAAGAFHLLPAPARVYDSRPGTLPNVGSKTKFAANETRTFDLKVNSSTVPAGATGALVTLLLVNASTTPGNATIWANGVTKPLANTMVWGGTAGRFTATATTALDTQARVQVNASQATDLVLDVVGYYR